MKKGFILIAAFLIMAASFVFAQEATSMTVKDFALKLAKELKIDKDIKGDSLTDIISVFPENLKNIFASYQGEMVNRQLAVDIFSYFLDPKEIDTLKGAGSANDMLSLSNIDNSFSMASREGDVLTYITPPTHSFTNRLDSKLEELYQSKGSGDNGY